MSNAEIKVAVGLSGGVDSGVTAYLLKSKGYQVTGVHMQCWDYNDKSCKGSKDRDDAVSVCSQLNIPFRFLNFEKEYKNTIIDYFYSEYRAGRTPNPDVLCNKEIKFGLFLEWAIKEGFDFIATGHYVRVGHENGNYHLLKGIDDSKDQSYFLYRLTQKQLSKTLFPVGGMKKNQIREIAREQKLAVADKAESMGICFVGEVDINKFLKRQIKPKQGEVVLKSTGETIGKHEGVWFYTIGQRHGFKIDKYVGLPLYVVGKSIEQNELIVGFYNDCLRNEFQVSDTHFIGGMSSNGNHTAFDCAVRIRHLGQLYKAQIVISDEGIAGVKLDNLAFGVAPGQSAVFYNGDVVLGGGIVL